jgi:hypothetical protein
VKQVLLQSLQQNFKSEQPVINGSGKQTRDYVLLVMLLKQTLLTLMMMKVKFII